MEPFHAERKDRLDRERKGVERKKERKGMEKRENRRDRGEGGKEKNVQRFLASFGPQPLNHSYATARLCDR